MRNLSLISDDRCMQSNDVNEGQPRSTSESFGETSADLAAQITKAASKQTFYTIRLFADRDRASDAYRAYAYFRWVDDMLDRELVSQPERLAFDERQECLIYCAYQGAVPGNLTAEEQLLVELIRHDADDNSGLQAYIRNMMAVMSFDARRRGRLISQQELNDYTQHLAVAVTEALHYFIGHGQPTAQIKTRYLAVSAAHITHMLRDTVEDTEAGYFNIPTEYVERFRIDPCAWDSPAYRAWVKSRVELAWHYFRDGRMYLARVKSLRCRLAGYAYIARFTGVLAAIERENFRLRANYSDCKRPTAVLEACWALVSDTRK